MGRTLVQWLLRQSPVRLKEARRTMIRSYIIHRGDSGRYLDWEAADYHPTFWTATKPPVSPDLDFYPPIAECDDFEWIKCLRMERLPSRR